MTDALSKALANAAANAPKGEELYLENLDSIADPTIDEPVKITQPPSAASQEAAYRQQMEAIYNNYKPQAFNYKPQAFIANDLEQDEVLLTLIKDVKKIVWDSSSRVAYLENRLQDIYNIISEAKQSMPQESDHKHRSLHEWDDQYLINELVERENDLMPFYYELLKRIGSPDLQTLVMSSMQGKNASMVTLAQLCAALGSMIQPQPQPNPMPDITLQESPGLHHSMDARYYRQRQPQPQHPSEALLNSGQSTEEYRQDCPATIPPMPPTYNPYFKEK